jgi:dienelactone hydrolase
MKKILLFCLSLLIALLASAQVSNEARAERLFSFVTAGMTDSIYACLNEKVRQAIPREMLGGLMRQLEPFYGKYSNKGAWRTEQSMGVTVYCCDARFDKGTLTFLTAFDSDGKANTLRFVPAEKAPVKEKLPAGITEDEVTLQSGAYKLPGLLTMPKNGLPVPAVVLVAGSGPNDKDETVGQNRPFHDIAWGLAQQGVAVYRYDKRTKVYGEKYIAAGEEADLNHEVVDDAVAAVQMLMKKSGIDSRRVYVVGHSLGAMLAPRIAQRLKGLAGIVMMAAPARPLEDLVVDQMIYLHSQGVPTAQDIAAIDSVKATAANVKKMDTPSYDAKVGVPFGLPLSYWRDLRGYDQIATAAHLNIPMLIVQGERDYQVTMTDFALWKRRLGNGRKVQYKVYPKLNHLFFEGSGPSSPVEYMNEHHVASYVVGDIVRFINHEGIQ